MKEGKLHVGHIQGRKKRPKKYVIKQPGESAESNSKSKNEKQNSNSDFVSNVLNDRVVFLFAC